VAGASLFALIDDIASVLDDVAVMTKVAATKTAGVLGDDLALNAQQLAGLRAARELPVVWSVAVGSARNKLVLVPVALALSAAAPWAVAPLLMIGGAYLCYEGVEKLAHRWLHSVVEDATDHAATLAALDDPEVDIVAFERDKIRGAIRTDFILSAEIIVIALGTVQSAPIGTRLAVLCGVAVFMTVGVYGFVAAIVKMDDAGLFLMRDAAAGVLAAFKRGLGRALLATAPRLLGFLSVAGTAAMFLVGGGIIAHGIPALHPAVHHLEHALQGVPGAGLVVSPLFDALVGLVAGSLVLALASVPGALRRQRGSVH
jgi:predicted DNA repair protein MutK